MTDIFSTFANGFAITAALIMAIGAQNMFVLRQGLQREHVGPIVLFCVVSDGILISAGVAGMGAALELVPGLSLFLSLGGACFLGWYGAVAFRRAATSSSMQVAGGGGKTLVAALAGAAGFTFLNPHVYLDTVLLMGAVSSTIAEQLRPVFVAGALTASVIWFTALGFGARFLSPLFARPAAWKILDILVGTMMVTMAIGLLVHAFDLA
ncbi:LysE/ArgO family amino acid transporter [Gimibacter soli]|uniref:LysE/ArgO family amino acid transporter n=1 Tax=Gimibacter soli TaxID=3024400 RepID=A0AAF0BL23_9PROT|nr:LysE/ArgO family amino acid transporter [Gimibacter soli]WCL53627.1 LysE/ArgO family amino acid transporter [Gimibacter soli]